MIFISNCNHILNLNNLQHQIKVHFHNETYYQAYYRDCNLKNLNIRLKLVIISDLSLNY